MIEIQVLMDPKGFIWGFDIQGHAAFGQYGNDIVCSAVSALAYTAAGALDELIGIRDYTERDGHMVCNVPKDISEETKSDIKIILNTILVGFKQIEFSYGEYVNILYKEVKQND